MKQDSGRAGKWHGMYLSYEAHEGKMPSPQPAGTPTLQFIHPAPASELDFSFRPDSSGFFRPSASDPASSQRTIGKAPLVCFAEVNRESGPSSLQSPA